MIDVYYWTTPNGHKVTIFLEETGLPIPSNRSTSVRESSLNRSFWRFHPTTVFQRSWTTIRPATASRSVFSSPARFFNISPRRPANFCPPICAAARKSCSGSSGKWAGWGRCLGKIITSETIPMRSLPMRSIVTSKKPSVSTVSTNGSPIASLRRRILDCGYGVLSWIVCTNDRAKI